MAPRYEAFGLRVASHFALDELCDVTAAGPADVELTLASTAEVRSAFSGAIAPPRVHEALLGDGCLYRVERGAAGDHAVDYGDRATFHLAPDAAVVRCAPRDVERPAWRRFLLDTVLGTAALVQGYEALHAAAALGESGLVAIAAETGGGKSTLLARLLLRGHLLFCDDILALSHRDGQVVAVPGPPLMNLEPVMVDGTSAGAVGRVLSVVDGECWTQVSRPPLSPVPVRAVVFLQRGAGRAARLEPLAPDPTLLLAHSLMSGRESERLARRFGLFADLAEQTQLVRLVAPSDAGPDELAELVEQVVA
jgi:hypothetical protein